MIRVLPLLIFLLLLLAVIVVVLLVRSRRRESYRTPDRLGRKDVVLLRDQHAILVELMAQDRLVPLGLSDDLLERIRAAMRRYSSTNELPE